MRDKLNMNWRYLELAQVNDVFIHIGEGMNHPSNTYGASPFIGAGLGMLSV